MSKIKSQASRDRYNKLRRDRRRERGLQKCGRKPNTPEQKEQADINRKLYLNKWHKDYARTHPQERLYWTAKSRAKRKGLEFSIDLEDVIIPEKCPYLGVELISQASRGTPRTYVMSLDRINSEEGYVKGNVEVISWLANTMKNNATTEQLVQFAKAVLERYD